jgi:peptidoglycan/xylan/chitin deacetylase (PgdA/CDA1 family)
MIPQIPALCRCLQTVKICVFSIIVFTIVTANCFGQNPLVGKDVRPPSNEAGQIPVLEYHNISSSPKLSTYEYSFREFRMDMEWLYAHKYRPINLTDFVRGWIDCPAGMSPVVITFDDASSGQFSYTKDGKIDPNCAVGILDSMHVEHPDWISKAMFFVLTDEDPKLPAPFTVPKIEGGLSQKSFAAKKMKYLVADGFEIGNHTLHHSTCMRTMSSAQVQAEFAGGAKGIEKYLPGYTVQTLALPYGIFPTHPDALRSGESAGFSYHNICAMAAGWNPSPSPISKYFRPYRIPRIIPGNNRTKPGGIGTIRYWLNQLELHPSEKFVSDGNPNVYTVPKSAARSLDLTRLHEGRYLLHIEGA